MLIYLLWPTLASWWREKCQKRITNIVKRKSMVFPHSLFNLQLENKILMRKVGNKKSVSVLNTTLTTFKTLLFTPLYKTHIFKAYFVLRITVTLLKLNSLQVL